ncbi:Ribosomal protein [Mycena chlorophos]|uniref:Ribosomal protein n=1 Tax=Mycena chlorophos TaxID=658473 RepID=A0A8H6W9L6_MYCCL|nr:Ribosomal protein [Mycena chlorophos]
MPMRIRLAMHGKTHQKVFHLVAIHQRTRRDARPAELLGVYNPHAAPGQTHKTVQWSVDRIRYWLHVGAVPSKSVVKLLELGNILKPGSVYHPHRASSASKPTAAPTPPKLSELRERIAKAEKL